MVRMVYRKVVRMEDFFFLNLDSEGNFVRYARNLIVVTQVALAQLDLQLKRPKEGPLIHPDYSTAARAQKSPLGANSRLEVLRLATALTHHLVDAGGFALLA